MFPMIHRPSTTADLRSRACRILCAITLAALLAGCDKCGDWWWSPSQGHGQVCRPDTPKPPQ